MVFVIGDYGRQDFWLIDLGSSARRRLTSRQPGLTIQGFDISNRHCGVRRRGWRRTDGADEAGAGTATSE